MDEIYTLLDSIDAMQRSHDITILDVDAERGILSPTNASSTLCYLNERRCVLESKIEEAHRRQRHRGIEALRSVVIDWLDPHDLGDSSEHVETLDRLVRTRDRLSLEHRYRRVVGTSCGKLSDEDIHREILSTQRAWLSSDSSFSMQCFDIEHLYETKSASIREVYRLYGRLRNGRSVCVDVTKVPSYFYVKIADSDRGSWSNARGKTEDLTAELNTRLRWCLQPTPFVGCRRHGCTCEFAKPQDRPSNVPCVKHVRNRVTRVVRSCGIVSGRSLVGYHPEEEVFLQVHVTYPFLMYPVVNWFRKQSKNRDADLFGCEIFEGNIAPINRLLVDKNIVGCGWIDVSSASIRTSPTTRCDLECTTVVSCIESRHEDVTNTPFRILALDIECMSIDVNVFPTPDRCPMIQMSTVARVHGRPELDEKKVFCLLETDNTTDGGVVHSYPTESALFLAIYQYIHEFDPDILTGYNSSKLFEASRRFAPHLPSRLTIPLRGEFGCNTTS